MHKNYTVQVKIYNSVKFFSFGVFIIILFSISSLTLASALPDLSSHLKLLDMAASGNNVYVVYNHKDLYFTKGFNGGLDFGKPFMINDLNSSLFGFSRIATAENNVYISWDSIAKNLSHGQTLFRKSMDGGVTFTSPIIISKNETDSQLLQLIAVQNHVYVTMKSEYLGDGKSYDNISFRASSDNGTTFEKSIDLLPNVMQNASSSPPVQIAASTDGKVIYVLGEYSPDCPVISDNTCTNQIFFEKSVDFGTTFSVPKIIYSTNQGFGDFRMYTSGEDIYLIWGEKPHDVNFMKSSDSGETFSMPIDLTKEISVGRSVGLNDIGLAANENNVYVVWGYVNNDNPPSLFLLKSTDNGNTFNQQVDLTGNDGYGTFDIQASDNSVYITWSSYQHKSEKTDILFRMSSDNGTNFDQTVNLSTIVNESSFMPMLATTGNDVYVGWGTAFPSDDLLIQTSHDGGNSFVGLINLGHISQTIIPEFPFAVLVLIISMASLIISSRIKFR